MQAQAHLEDAERILSEEEDKAICTFHRGELLLAQGQLDEAVKLFEASEYSFKADDLMKVQFLIAKAHFLKQDTKSAEACLLNLEKLLQDDQVRDAVEADEKHEEVRPQYNSTSLRDAADVYGLLASLQPDNPIYRKKALGLYQVCLGEYFDQANPVVWNALASQAQESSRRVD